MPAQTPIYSLPYPLPGDPIRDGAENMETLAKRIESVFSNLEVPVDPGGGGGYTPPAVCKIVRTSAQNIANATDVTVTWQAAEWDSQPGGAPMFSSTGITIRETGLYAVKAIWPWAANGTGRRNLKVTKNSTTTNAAILCDAMNATPWENVCAVADDLYLTAGDVLRMIVAQDCGGNLPGGKGASAAANVLGSLSATFLRTHP